MALLGDVQHAMDLTKECMNDYKRIRNSSRGYRRLSPHDTLKIHSRSIERMNAFLNSHDPFRTIVVTHHAPSARSLEADRRDKTLSCAYASHLEEFILRHQPHLWIHGHVHHSNDYHIGRTRVIANPQGYPDEPNEGFIPALVVEV